MTENKMRLQLIESTFAALARTRCAEIAHQPETERNGGWGGWEVLRAQTPTPHSGQELPHCHRMCVDNLLPGSCNKSISPLHLRSFFVKMGFSA